METFSNGASLLTNTEATLQTVDRGHVMTTEFLKQLSDRELLETTARAAANERRSMVELVELLAEVDARGLYLAEGCSSLFTYCTEVLRLSEHGAYHRIAAARAVRSFPVIAEHLRGGSMTLTTVALLRPHLTLKNHSRVLADARNKSKREVERQIACLVPKPEALSLVRRLPAAASTSTYREIRELMTGAAPKDGDSPPPLDSPPAAQASPGSPVPEASRGSPVPEASSIPNRSHSLAWQDWPRFSDLLKSAPDRPVVHQPKPKVEPLNGDRYLLRISLSAAGHANLRRAQDLMRHSLPTGDLGAVVERAWDVLVSQLERQKVASTSRPRMLAATRGESSSSSAGASSSAGSSASSGSGAGAGAHSSAGSGAGSSSESGSSAGAGSSESSGSRYLPAAIRRAVWKRDAGRCAFIGPRGRCKETGGLEFHHLVPFARGGLASEGNIALRCRAHNAYEGELCFGRREKTAH